MSNKSEPERHPWHALTTDQVNQLLKTGKNGLTTEEAEQRLYIYGLNEIGEAKPVSALRLLLDQFKSVLLLILISAIIFSILVGHTTEAAVIAIIIAFSVLLGFFQEYRAEKSMAALRQMAAPNATVKRNGQWQTLPAVQLVPGDRVKLKAGDKVPADIRLFETASLKLNESLLTGESDATEKEANVRLAATATPSDRLNIAHAGATVSRGRGEGLVIATGMATEFGSIVTLLQTASQGKTPLQKSLDRMGNNLAIAAVVLVAIITILGLFRGEPLDQMLLFAVALAVAVVPEALPAVVTISLAIGARRMIKRNALIRRLPAVETLGCASVICSDKTGTLTRDEMTVRKLWIAGTTMDVTGEGFLPEGKILQPDGTSAPITEPLKELLKAITLVNDAGYKKLDNGQVESHGDPTELALLVAAAKAGIWQADLIKDHPRKAEIPFSSETRFMTSIHATPAGDRVAYLKGALEVVLDRCTDYLTPAGTEELGESTRKQIRSEAEKLASQAIRVIAVARKQNPQQTGIAEAEYTFLGLTGMVDPPRPESKAAIDTCIKAGIRVVMITGDHPLTARAIAHELGILRQGRVVTGAELEHMNAEELNSTARQVEVFARVTPKDKLRVVEALQQQQAVVAMTGDGVNDAPALKKADIGIAMGINGTDVSREAADMTLMDDNFATIVAAVEEGRGIYSNIRKYLMYMLSSNIGEIGLMAIATLAGLPLPLSAVQILYVNLATDGLPALALALDPVDENLMKQPPRKPREGIFSKPVVLLMLVGGLWSTGINYSLFYLLLQQGQPLAKAMTMVFSCLVLIELFKAYNFRSERRTVFHKPLANRWLNLAILWELSLLIAVTQIPALETLFGTVALTRDDWLTTTAIAATIIPILELTKYTIRHIWQEP